MIGFGIEEADDLVDLLTLTNERRQPSPWSNCRTVALQMLWEKFEERGLALKPFADLADGLAVGDADDKPVAARVTCGDLRAAKRAR